MPDKNTLAHTTIDVVLTQWPRTARVFYQFKMACVGCPLAPYYTVAEAANIYRLPLDTLLGEILSVIAEELHTP